MGRQACRVVTRRADMTLVAPARDRYVTAHMYRALRPLLFMLSPDAAHAMAFAALGAVEHVGPVRAMTRAILVPAPDARIAVRAMGLDFASPLGVAGGFDKNALRP